MSKIEKYLKKHLSKIDTDLDSTICGSYRRKKETSGDIDILLTHKDIIKSGDLEDQDYLCQLITILKKDKFIVDDLTYNGNTKYMGMCKIPKSDYARRIDIRFVPYNSFSAATLYFTGSKNLNQIMRELAIKKGYKLNEYGLYKTEFNKSLNKLVEDYRIKCSTEKEIFEKIEYEWLEPTQRNIT